MPESNLAELYARLEQAIEGLQNGSTTPELGNAIAEQAELTVRAARAELERARRAQSTTDSG